MPSYLSLTVAIVLVGVPPDDAPKFDFRHHYASLDLPSNDGHDQLAPVHADVLGNSLPFGKGK